MTNASARGSFSILVALRNSIKARTNPRENAQKAWHKSHLNPNATPEPKHRKYETTDRSFAFPIGLWNPRHRIMLQAATQKLLKAPAGRSTCETVQALLEKLHSFAFWEALPRPAWKNQHWAIGDGKHKAGHYHHMATLCDNYSLVTYEHQVFHRFSNVFLVMKSHHMAYHPVANGKPNVRAHDEPRWHLPDSYPSAVLLHILSWWRGSNQRTRQCKASASWQWHRESLGAGSKQSTLVSCESTQPNRMAMHVGRSTLPPRIAVKPLQGTPLGDKILSTLSSLQSLHQYKQTMQIRHYLRVLAGHMKPKEMRIETGMEQSARTNSLALRKRKARMLKGSQSVSISWIGTCQKWELLNSHCSTEFLKTKEKFIGPNALKSLDVI